VSDFLGRLAARAVGEIGVARPRVPPVFEPAEAATEPPLEIVDEEVVAPVPPRRAPGETPDPAIPQPPTPRAPLPLPMEGVTAAPAAAPAGPPPAGIARQALSEATQDEPLPDRDAVRAEPRTSSPAAPAVIAVPAAPPSPPAVVAGARAAASPPLSAVAHDESRTVRVHIGRLEVRANLHEAPREQQRREPRQPEGLSLADYLRGKREAVR
jgi:hypothetical protein